MAAVVFVAFKVLSRNSFNVRNHFSKLIHPRLVCKMATAADTGRGRNVVIHGERVPVTVVDVLSPDILDKALSCVPFREWVEGMDTEIKISKIHFDAVDMFGERVGFMKFRASATFHGKPVPGIVFMRGGAVAILVVLHCDNGKRYALCCRQPRVPVGKSAFLEIPAGMLDGSGHFAGVAAKELKEETGIEITEDQLVDMTGLAYGPETNAYKQGLRGMYPSVGACDEFLRLLYFQKNVTTAELEALRGKATGCIDEDEAITLDLVEYEELWREAPDSKTLSALLLHEKLTALGLMK